MIDEKLQRSEAKNLNINLDQKKIDQAKEEIANNFNKNSSELSSFFKDKDISYDSFLDQIKSQLLWSEVIQSKLAPKIKVNRNEIDELLEFKKIDHNVSKYFIFEIFIPSHYKNNQDNIDGLKLVDKLFNEIKSGKDFSNIARQFSRSPTAEFGGEIGFVGKGDVDERIYQKISNTQLEDITKVVTEDGYYIFKVTDKKTFSTLSEVDQSQIRAIIFNKKMQLEARSYLMDLKKGAYIEIDKIALRKLKI
jgi:peptidyl-prolyl cis-trans isomerase SurA